MEKRSLQFELWEECNNQCKFCYLRNGNKFTSTELKLKSLDDAMSKLNDDQLLAQYNVLSFIGGEFFQGQLHDKRVKDKFFQLMSKTSELIRDKKITELWLNATMTTGNQADLFETLDKLAAYDNVWLCTSFDTVGRFDSPCKLNIWEHTMRQLQARYPKLKYNVSMILTTDLITKYLNDQFSFKDFKCKWKCQIFLKTPGTGGLTQTLAEKQQFNAELLPGFFPTRELMLKFLVKYRMEEPEFEYDKIYNIQFRADDLYKNTTENQFSNYHFQRVKDDMMVDYKIESGNRETLSLLPCGHRIVYTPYSDSDACFLCDKAKIRQII